MVLVRCFTCRLLGTSATSPGESGVAFGSQLGSLSLGSGNLVQHKLQSCNSRNLVTGAEYCVDPLVADMGLFFGLLPCQIRTEVTVSGVALNSYI